MWVDSRTPRRVRARTEIKAVPRLGAGNTQEFGPVSRQRCREEPMWSNFQKTSPERIVVSIVSLLVVLMAAAFLKTFAGAEKTGEWATYSHGVLRVVIPYRAAQAGAG